MPQKEGCRGMSEDKEITNQIAIDTLEKLITDRMEQLNNTPFFLELERENLEMEIRSYKKHLRNIREVPK